MDDIEDFAFGIIAAGVAISIIIGVAYFVWRHHIRKRNKEFSISNPMQPASTFEVVYMRTFVNHSASAKHPVPSEEGIENDVQTLSVNNNLSSTVAERRHSTSKHETHNDRKVVDNDVQVYNMNKYSPPAIVTEQKHSLSKHLSQNDRKAFDKNGQVNNVRRYSSPTYVKERNKYITPNDGKVFENDVQVCDGVTYSPPTIVTERRHSTSKIVTSNGCNVFHNDVQMYNENKYSPHTTFLQSKYTGPQDQNIDIYETHSGFLKSGLTSTDDVREKPQDTLIRNNFSSEVNAQNATFENGGDRHYVDNYQRQGGLQLRPAYSTPTSNLVFTYI